MAIVLYVGGSKDGEKGVVPYGFSKSRADTALEPEFYTERFMELQGVGKVRLMALEGMRTRSSCSAPPATTADLRNAAGAPTIGARAGTAQGRPGPRFAGCRRPSGYAAEPCALSMPCPARRGLPEWGLPVRHRPEAMHDANAQSALAQQIAQTIAEIGAQSAQVRAAVGLLDEGASVPFIAPTARK